MSASRFLHASKGSFRQTGGWILGLLLLAQPLLAQQPTVPESTPQVFVVDAHSSSIVARVGVGGWLSWLDSDHLLVAAGFAGRIVLPASIEKATVQLSIPTNSLRIDLPEDRTRWGLPLIESVDLAQIQALVLGENQLHTNAHPRITLTTLGVGGEMPSLNLLVEVRLLGKTTRLEVPVHVTVDEGGLRASGELVLSRSFFGMAPVERRWGGAVLDDEVRVVFDIFAKPVVTE